MMMVFSSAGGEKLPIEDGGVHKMVKPNHMQQLAEAASSEGGVVSGRQQPMKGGYMINLNSEQHELSTIMEREQLTTSQRRSSNDLNDNIGLQRHGSAQQHPQFFQRPSSKATHHQNPIGLSSDLMNPDEENFNNNNLFVTNQPIIKRIHPLTTTNKQFNVTGGNSQPSRILIPTTPTTVHDHHNKAYDH